MMPENPSEFDALLQNCLENLLSGTETLDEVVNKYPHHADELRPLLEAALLLRASREAFKARPGWINASKTRLVARIQQEQHTARQRGYTQPKPVSRRWLNWFPRGNKLALQFLTLLLVSILVISAGSGAALAAQDAIPGDGLYPLKTTMEQTALAISLDYARGARLHLQFAEHRIDEVENLLVIGRYGYIEQTLANYDYQIQQAVRLAQDVALKNPQKAKDLAIDLQARLEVQRPRLATALANAPDENKISLEHTVQISQQGAAQIQNILDEAVNQPTLEPTPTSTMIVFFTPTLTMVPNDTKTLFTPTELPYGLYKKLTETAMPTATVAAPVATSESIKPSNTPRPTNINQPTQKPGNTPKPTNVNRPTQKPSKTPKP